MEIRDLGNRVKHVWLKQMGEDMSRVKHHQSTGKGHTSFGMSRQVMQARLSWSQTS